MKTYNQIFLRTTKALRFTLGKFLSEMGLGIFTHYPRNG